MNVNLVIFSVIATLTVLGAIGVVFFPNAVRSALSLVATFGLLSVLYLTLNANLLAWTQLLVYTGAIMVLFLFVIMVLNLRRQASLDEKRDPKRVIGAVLGAAFAGLIGVQVLTPYIGVVDMRFAPQGYGQPEAIGKALFTDYGYPFEAVSVLLLVGIVGSILLAKRRIR
ncbi:MAG: NADH-quinone oxidoreductase subunit J family protein [Fimbriimonadaceae bacterium]